jgi:hypothetical protein
VSSSPISANPGFFWHCSLPARGQSDRMAAGRMAEPLKSLDEKIFHTTKNWHQFSIFAAKRMRGIHMD